MLSYEKSTSESGEAFKDAAQNLIDGVLESHKAHDPRYSPTLLLEKDVDVESKTVVFSIRETIETLPIEGEQQRYSLWVSKNGEAPRQIFEDHGWPTKGDAFGFDFTVDEGVVTVSSDRKGEQRFTI
jgi:hypothetical protein